MRNQFTIAKRQTGGRVVYYYYTYDKDGNRRKFSTGRTTKAAALAYCLDLSRAGLLVPAEKNNATFENFYKDFWDWEKSTYLKKERLRGHELGKKTAYNRQIALKNMIEPYFAKLKVKDITKTKLENWLLALADRGFKPGSINQARIILNIMLEYAVEQGYLAANPCRVVKPFVDRPEARGVLDLMECNELFNPKNIGIYWNDNRITYAANLLSALTGMRLNEVRALRRQDIKDGYLLVEHSIDNFGLKDTKNHKSREIPISSELQTILVDICPAEGGFVFSVDGKEPSPVYSIVTGGLYKALAAMGISKEERQRRNICFHSWRHFYNTMLRAGNVSEAKIRAITGHSDERMTDRYTHFTHKELAEIASVQNLIMGGCYA